MPEIRNAGIEITTAEDTDIIPIQKASGLSGRIKRSDFLAGITSSSSSGTGASPWALKSSDYTAVAGDRLIIDTSANSWLLTLPSTPSFGNEIEIYGIRGLKENKLNLDFNQSKYKGSAANSAFYNSLYAPTKLIYIDSILGWLDTASIIVALGNYPNEVIKDSPYLFLRLGELSGTTAVDSSGDNRNGTYQNNPMLGTAGSLTNDTNTAVTFNGTSNFISFANSVTSPPVFTIECRFKTSAVSGGLFGFANSQLTGGGSYDRDLHITSDGKVRFYIFNGGVLVSPLSYNDNQWHTATAVLYSGGTELWIDGSLVASSTNANAPSYGGYWHIGYGVTGGYFKGVIDEPSIAHTRISPERIKLRHQAAIQ